MMKRQLLTLMLVGMLAIAIALQYVSAVPGGASITSNTTAGVPTTTASNRSDARGTITTIVLDSLQQDQNWKAYVGNITGKLSLDDATGNTIYDWGLNSVNKSGEVYVSRASAPVWIDVTCVNGGNVTAEETFHNMTVAQTDNINKTFNYTSHAAFYVGTVQINASTCKSTATYVNDLRSNNPINGNQVFQEVILQDSGANIIFTTLVTGNQTGFDGRQYDFQIIVPESAIKATPTTYYFFTELSG